MNNSKQQIIDALPEIIRLDQTFEDFAKATGFDLLGFNDAVVIRKKDMACLADDGVISDKTIKVLFENLLAGLDSFYIGSNKYQTFALDNDKNPFGDPKKAKLYGLARSASVSGEISLVA